MRARVGRGLTGDMGRGKVRREQTEGAVLFFVEEKSKIGRWL
jgi:hypothetical protein